MSAVSHRSLSLMNDAAPTASARASRPDATYDVPPLQHVLGPEEVLLAILAGSDSRGPVTWVATTKRLVVLGSAHPDEDIVDVAHSAVTCVALSTDPMGTSMRVRATGRQLCMQTSDATMAAQFGSLLRERAGIGAPASLPRRVLDPMPASHHVATRLLR